MYRRRLTAWSALVLAGALTLGACGSRGTSGDQQQEQQTPDKLKAYLAGHFDSPDAGSPKDGGTLTFADFAEPRTLDPAVVIATGSSGGTALVAVYDQLVRYNSKTEEYEPHLAESIEPNDDHTVWTVTLREGATFSDGSPVDADAVIGSVNRYIAMKGYDFSTIGPLWEGIHKVDELTVEFRLTAPWATFDGMLGQGMGFIVAPAAYTDPKNFRPIGAGAFTLESYRPQEDLVLAANPKYWNGKPHLDKLRFVWHQADQTKFEAMNSGQAQMAYLRDPKIVAELREQGAPGVIQLDGLGMIIQINGAEGKAGSHATVRKAIALALNPEQIYQRAFDGKGLPTKNIFGPISRWSVGQELTPHDPERARELVQQARDEGWDGTLQVLTTSDPVSRNQMLVLQGQLEAVGITVEADYAQTTTDIINKMYVERSYEVARTGFSVNEADPYQRLFVMYHSKSVARTAPSDPRMDQLIDELRQTPTEDRAAVIARIEEQFAEFNPTVSIGMVANFMTWQPNVHGVVGTNETMMAFDAAWLS